MTIRKIVSRSIQDGAISTTDISSSDLSIDAGTLFIDSTNNRVGVGTTSPAVALDVSGNFRSWDGALVSSSSPTHYIASGNNSDSVALEVRQGRYNKDALVVSSNQSLSANLLRLSENGTDRFVVTGSGAVGIGASSPAPYKLNVNNGAIRAIGTNGEGFITTDDTIGRSLVAGKDSVGVVLGYAGTAGMIQGGRFNLSEAKNLSINPYGGNVGVGTDSPSCKLDLGGTYSGSANNLASNVKLSVTTISSTEKYGFYVDDFASLVFLSGSDAGNNAKFRWVSANTERMRLDSNGTLVLNQGQIKFPVTQNASSDANTLDDYEEGTWTPQVVGRTSGSATMTGATGSYRKIGSLVFVTAYFQFSKNTINGQVIINNLPFTAANISGIGQYPSGSVGYWYGLATAMYNITTYVNNSTNIAEFRAVSAATGNVVALLDTNLAANGNELLMTVTYIAA